jgi:hypothetical protein
MFSYTGSVTGGVGLLGSNVTGRISNLAAFSFSGTSAPVP